MNEIVIFVTCANKKQAKLISTKLVENRLAACVNVLDKIKSFFRWEGKIYRLDEVLLIIKSERKNLQRIIKLVKSMHSYDVPEIIALPIIGGYRPYLRWIDESVR